MRKKQIHKQKFLTLFLTSVVATTLLVTVFPKNLSIKQLSSGAGFDQAAKFDGQTGYISVPDHSSLQPNANFTVEAWVKPELPPNNNAYNGYTIVSKYVQNTTSSSSYRLTLYAKINNIQPTPKVNYYYDFVVANGNNCISNNVLYVAKNYIDFQTFTTWKHIAAEIDNGDMLLFENGQLLAKISTNLTTFCETPSPLTIGGRNTNNLIGDYLPGLIDELRISNIVRYTNNFIPPIEQFLIDDNTMAIYRFNGNVYDLSGNNNHGTIYGNVTFVDSTIGPPPASPSPNPTPSPKPECPQHCVGKRKPMCITLPCRVK